MKRRSRIFRDLGSRKYRIRVLPNKKRAARFAKWNPKRVEKDQ